MERKETITLLELAKRVGDYVSADTLAEKFKEQMEWINLPSEYFDDIADQIQWFVIDETDAKYLIKYSNEVVTYVDEIDMYFWGVTDLGTQWQGVNVEMTYDY